MDPKPWEIDPSLTRERLYELGKIIRDVRHGAIILHDPDEGDGYWSLGCRVYERTINIIERETKRFPWLTIHRSNSLYFVIYIEDIPIRFYRGRIDEPTKRTLQQGIPEICGRQIPFPFLHNQWFWRIAVETDEERKVLRLILAQFEESANHRYPWEILVTDTILTIAPLIHTQREGTILDSPIITSRDEETKESI